ncbi:MAG TPA: hypothetical protein HPP87_01015 [Planctomycetes bacterium]|nr:hypothetical protein [Planctomycetota bacterium]
MEKCKLRNPRGEQTGVTVYRNGMLFRDMGGAMMDFDTSTGDNFVIVQKGSPVLQYKRTILGG